MKPAGDSIGRVARESRAAESVGDVAEAEFVRGDSPGLVAIGGGAVDRVDVAFEVVVEGAETVREEREETGERESDPRGAGRMHKMRPDAACLALRPVPRRRGREGTERVLAARRGVVML